MTLEIKKTDEAVYWLKLTDEVVEILQQSGCIVVKDTCDDKDKFSKLLSDLHTELYKIVIPKGR